MSEKPSDFYGELTDAFLSGQTYFKLQPDPGLKNLADPYLDAPWVPRLHDVTYFQGRYYLYFGAGPVLALFAPWRLMFSSFLAEGLGTTIFVAAGFLFGATLLWKIWHRWFNTLSPTWLGGAVLIWGLGSYPVILLDTPGLYSVPITFAHASITGALLALWNSLVSASRRATLGWFACSSFLWAAALSGRPNYLFSLAALALPFFHIRSIVKTESGGRSAAVRQVWLAGAIPVLAVGTALASYNWVRYGSITEFGVHWQFAMGDQRQTKLFELRNFPVNLETYLFNSPELSPYFPFTSNIESGCGILGCMPLVALALVFPWSLRTSRFRQDRLWRVVGLTLLVALLLNFTALLGVPWGCERYITDFMPLAMMLALLTGGWLLNTLQNRARIRFAVSIALTALAGWTLTFSALFIVARYSHREAIAPLARIALQLAHRLEVVRGIGHGPLHLNVAFPDAAAGTSQPLVVSGHGRDVLFVTFLEKNQAQFGFFHSGNTAVMGEKVAIVPGRTHLLDIDLGALYPPSAHPLMAGWSPAQIELLTRVVTVRLDGTEVLHTNSLFYPTHPDDVLLGANPRGLVTEKRFTGTITAASPRAMPAPSDLAGRREEGPVRLTVTLPPFTVFRREPLVSTGRRGAGDILFVSYVGKDRISFGHDSWNGGAIETEIVAYDFTRPQEIEIDMGSLRQSTAAGVSRAPLVIRFNGRTLLEDVRPFNPSQANQVVFGFNGMGSSIVAEAFGGRLVHIETLARLPTQPPVNRGYGSVHLVARFPRGGAGRSEPLLTTGRAGAGDVIYVTYIDDTHVRLGIDHWGVGGSVSEPRTIDIEKLHALDISIGSLLPPESDPWWANVSTAERQHRRTHLKVALDGAIVFDQPQAVHPSLPEQVVTGSNPIGASSCTASFSGTIFVASRETTPPVTRTLPP